MKQQILDTLDDYFQKTNGGLSIVKLKEMLKIDVSDLKKELNELYAENKILIRQGVNNKLIYANKTRTTNM